MKKGFDSEPVCNKKYLKTEKYSYEGRIDSSFHGDKVPKDSSQCTCLSVVLIDSVFRIGENYYPQVFLKEYKRKKITNMLLMNQKFLLMTKILIRKLLAKKILMKKFLMKNKLSIVIGSF